MGIEGRKPDGNDTRPWCSTQQTSTRTHMALFGQNCGEWRKRKIFLEWLLHLRLPAISLITGENDKRTFQKKTNRNFLRCERDFGTAASQEIIKISKASSLRCFTIKPIPVVSLSLTRRTIFRMKTPGGWSCFPSLVLWQTVGDFYRTDCCWTDWTHGRSSISGAAVKVFFLYITACLEWPYLSFFTSKIRNVHPLSWLTAHN